MKENNNFDKIILGIDPGTGILGYGIVGQKGNKIELITLGVVKLKHLDSHSEKLGKIFTKVNSLIKNYNPDCISLEDPFYGNQNPQVLLKLGRVQGVVMAAAVSNNLDFFEYAPKVIKKSITGNGNASKEQVSAMVQKILNFKESPEFLDATDGLSAAVCHAFKPISFNTEVTKNVKSKSSASSWGSFLNSNPNRIIK